MGSNLTDKGINKGLPIFTAIEKFVNNFEVDKAIALKPKYYDEAPETLSSAALIPEELRESVVGGLRALNSLVQSGKVVSLRVELLVKQLQKGKLKAFGFPLHEKSYNKRVEVPEFLLHAKYIKSGQSQIVGYDKKYVDVLIVRASDLPKEESTPGKTKIGRPLIKDKIRTVIQMLDSEGTINPAWSVKAIGELILERGKKEFPFDFFARDKKVKPGRSTIEKEYNKYRRFK